MKRVVAILLAVAIAAPGLAQDPGPTLDEQTKASIRTAVKRGLRDPESARFRWLPRQSEGTYCGYVNAKNAYGGYSGFALFMVQLNRGRDGWVSTPPIGIASTDTSSPSYLTLADQCLSEGIRLTAPVEDDGAD